MKINDEMLAASANRMMAALGLHETNPDVQYLLKNERFMGLLQNAIERKVSRPVSIGIERWMLESNIRSCSEINSALSELYFLFRGELVPIA